MHLPNLSHLERLAERLGVSAVASIPAELLVIEDRFADLCASPHQCPNYGLSPGCPPHVVKPARFRRELAEHRLALVFKIDVPMAVLQGEERLAVARRIHEIAAGLEREALARGFQQARGLAAGSCKELFCREEEVCAVLARGESCLHPELARCSLSGLGVDCQALVVTVGWELSWTEIENSTTAASAMGLMLGMVLLT